MRYVMIGLDSDQAALDLLDIINKLPDEARDLRVVSGTKDDGRVTLKKFRVRTTYLKDL